MATYSRNSTAVRCQNDDCKRRWWRTWNDEHGWGHCSACGGTLKPGESLIAERRRTRARADLVRFGMIPTPS